MKQTDLQGINPDTIVGGSRYEGSERNYVFFPGSSPQRSGDVFPADTGLLDLITEDATQVFGPSSRPVFTESFAPDHVRSSLFSAGPVYGLSILGLFLLFCFVTYFFRGNFGVLFSGFRGNASFGKLMNNQSSPLEHLISVSIFFFLFGISVTLIRVGYEYIWPSNIPSDPIVESVLLPVAICIVSIVYLYQIAVLKLSASITGQGKFADAVIRTRKICLAAGGLVLTPLILCFSLSSSRLSSWLIILYFALLTAIVIYMFYRIIILFRQQKISILTWILYLCTIEIFPISLCVVMAFKLGRQTL